MIYLAQILSRAVCLPLLFLAIGAATAVPQTAQQSGGGPSLEVTLKFIGDLMTAESPITWTDKRLTCPENAAVCEMDHRREYRNFSQAGCVLSWEERYNDVVVWYKVSADFSKVNPLSVKVEPKTTDSGWELNPQVYGVKGTSHALRVIASS